MTVKERFDIANKLPFVSRPARHDFTAFQILASKFPYFTQMIAHADRGEIFLLDGVSTEDLEALTQDEVDQLRTLGVWYNKEYGCLSMYP